jgi:hypothetical protein
MTIHNLASSLSVTASIALFLYSKGTKSESAKESSVFYKKFQASPSAHSSASHH